MKDSNPRPQIQILVCCRYTNGHQKSMGLAGVEPATHWLKASYAANCVTIPKQKKPPTNPLEASTITMNKTSHWQHNLHGLLFLLLLVLHSKHCITYSKSYLTKHFPLTDCGTGFSYQLHQMIHIIHQTRFDHARRHLGNGRWGTWTPDPQIMSPTL